MSKLAVAVVILSVYWIKIHGYPLPDEVETYGKKVVTVNFETGEEEDPAETYFVVNKEEEEDESEFIATRKVTNLHRRDSANSGETEEDDCSGDSAECNKSKKSTPVTPSNELQTDITYKLQRLGFYGGRARRSHRNKDDKEDNDDSIAILNDMKKVIKSAYSGVVSEVKKRRKDMTSAQKEMLDIYLKQLKIATDFSVAQIEAFKDKLKKGKNENNESASKENYADDGGEIIYASVVNFDRQYDAIYNYMYDKK